MARPGHDGHTAREENSMNGTPWHPAIVHLPIGLGLVAPLVVVAAAFALWRGRLTRRGWALVVVLQAAVLGCGLLAMRTGEQEEDRVEKVVEERLVKEHEERAELFLWLAGGALAAGAAVLVLPAGGPTAIASVAAVLLATAAAGAVAWTGHLGGRLVYVHGAARAYRSETGAAGS
jgi:uncharacterized membrane protein